MHGGPRRLGVLVTDGTYKHTLGIVRQLGGAHDVFVATTRKIAIASTSRYAQKSLVCPSPEDQAKFIVWLDRVVREDAIDQIIPVGAQSCELLSRYRDRWLPGTCIVLAEPEQVATALDKVAVGHVAQKVGIAVPLTRLPQSLDELEEAGERVGYPLVIKAALEGATGVAYVDYPQQLRTTMERYLRRYNWSADTLPLLQQRIIGPGFGVFATYQDGVCRRLMAHRRIREFPAAGGASTCAELVHDPCLLELGKRLLDALNWHGVAMVEFKQDAVSGTYYLMEVNPKFWGSLELGLAAGADFPGDLIAIGSGETLPFAPPPTGKLRFCWPLSGDLRHLIERPSAWRAVVGDWLDPRVQTNIWISDPLPHVVELAQTAYWFVQRLRRRPGVAACQ